ncbi:MAG TPA: MFS transporter [Candidatus Angelobacter sp.]|jgi:PAT family beta-lactamase induction signal transducer AmpG|nr:MFS transporter [Candidatus Angelobacter sp.]
MTSSLPKAPHPAKWVPTLYFAEGLPFFAVATIASLMYKSRGVPNDVITSYTSYLGIFWIWKFLWSPFLEAFKTKKFFVLLFQAAGGLSLALLALTLPLPHYFTYTIALLAVVAFSSSTHDIAADGLYIASLSSKEQAAWAGWQGGFYNVARFFSQGGLIILAGYLEKHLGITTAWMIVFGGLGAIMLLLSFYHSWALPKIETERHSESIRDILTTLWDVIVTFFKKPNIWVLIVFIILYRAGEGQVVKVGPLFLRDAVSTGGLGLSTDQVGAVYGTVASLAFIGGSILGGYFTSWLGLKRALFFLVCAMNLPNLAYVFLSVYHPANTIAIATALSVEMFGYGFGFVGVILLMMQEIAPGKYQTSHYSLASGVMQAGFVLFGWMSGKIQMRIGYQSFFIWVLISAIPALILSRFIPIRGGTQVPAAAQAAEV